MNDQHKKALSDLRDLKNGGRGRYFLDSEMREAEKWDRRLEIRRIALEEEVFNRIREIHFYVPPSDARKLAEKMSMDTKDRCIQSGQTEALVNDVIHMCPRPGCPCNPVEARTSPDCPSLFPIDGDFPLNGRRSYEK